MIEKPQDQIVVIGKTTNLSCKYNYGVRCSWERNGIPVTIEDNYQYIDGQNGEQTTDCSLKITAVNVIDLGDWKCAHKDHNMSVGLISYSAALMGIEVILNIYIEY